jgi:hypothetical protein
MSRGNGGGAKARLAPSGARVIAGLRSGAMATDVPRNAGKASVVARRAHRHAATANAGQKVRAFAAVLRVASKRG